MSTLMAASPTWSGLARGLLVLGALWWAETIFFAELRDRMRNQLVRGSEV